MIITPRLKLINLTTQLAEAMLTGDAEFEKVLKATVPADWSEEKIAIETFYNATKKDPENFKWATYVTIHVADNKLIGCCGFKGKPQAGAVEIGYEIHPDYRGAGLAQEVANGLMEFAFSHDEVNTVLAHTLADENASGSILKKLGFTFVKQYNDPEDGEIWQWQIKRKL